MPGPRGPSPPLELLWPLLLPRNWPSGTPASCQQSSHLPPWPEVAPKCITVTVSVPSSAWGNSKPGLGGLGETGLVKGWVVQLQLGHRKWPRSPFS